MIWPTGYFTSLMLLWTVLSRFLFPETASKKFSSCAAASDIFSGVALTAHLKQTITRRLEDPSDSDINLFTERNWPHVVRVEKVFFDSGQSSDHLGQVGHLCDPLHKLHLMFQRKTRLKRQHCRNKSVWLTGAHLTSEKNRSSTCSIPPKISWRSPDGVRWRPARVMAYKWPE